MVAVTKERTTLAPSCCGIFCGLVDSLHRAAELCPGPAPHPLSQGPTRLVFLCTALPALSYLYLGSAVSEGRLCPLSYPHLPGPHHIKQSLRPEGQGRQWHIGRWRRKEVDQGHKITSVAYQLPQRNATYANQRDKYLGMVRVLTFES